MPGQLILIIDDEPNIVQLARIYLERDGFRVEAVGDGRAALGCGPVAAHGGRNAGRVGGGI